MGVKEPDFSGWATKNDLKCSDGRTIKPGAFKHMDKQRVPLVWMHQHLDSENVLGHAILEDRAFGVYTHGYFNNTQKAQDAKEQVIHGDIVALSIYANRLTEKNKDVYHGDIKEVSLVLAGANPGAVIDNITLAHGEGFDTLNDEAIIYTGLTLEHADEGDSDMADENDANETETLGDVLESFSDKQRKVVIHMLNQALGTVTDSEDEDSDEDAVEHSNSEDNDSNSEENDSDLEHSNTEIKDLESAVIAHFESKLQEGSPDMARNVFEQNGSSKDEGNTLTHDQFSAIYADAVRGGSFRESMLAHAGEYGITDMEFLFPDAKALSRDPELFARRMDWVSVVLGGTKHSPFAKVKSIVADLTADEARAKGYIKGTMKKDEVIKLLRRTTSPTTVYKKQKLDRDDILDTQDMDVVAWLKAEIRLMLEEEIARAILVGDGRDALNDDKIKDPEGALDGVGIRSILHDADFYAHKVALAANVAPKDAVKGLVRARSNYRGTGKPTLFVSDAYLTDIMLEEDKFGRPLYETEQSLADKLRVSNIVTVDLFDDTEDLLAIMVNLADYTIGSNKGGELTSFEDFDIDYNQNKYLMETRISGALTKPKSAVVVTRNQGTAATPAVPSFADNTITIPTTTGVGYTINGDAVTGDVVITEDTTVEAVAEEGYYFAPGTTTDWSYTYTAA